MKPGHSTGVQFPLADDGSFSTSRAGARILAAALHPFEPRLAEAALGERRWRRNYPAHIAALVRHGLSGAEAALASGRAGIDAAWNTMEWSDADGRRPLSAAWGTVRQAPLGSVTVEGRGDHRPRPWQLPWRGELLAGDALRRRIDDWARRHVIEPGAAVALGRCIDNPDWFDLSDRRVAVLGAGAEVGPLALLAHWRAEIVAVDLPRGEIWQRIAATVAAGNARLHAPLAGPGDGIADAGADLIADAPRIADWLASGDRPLDLAALAYADGERHLRLSLAMDWIVRAVLDSHSAATAAWLATPTDAFPMPAATAHASVAAWNRRRLAVRVLRPVLRVAGLDSFRPNVGELLAGPGGREYAIADSIVLQQGPNYALAKRLQQWRALDARARGRRVSFNIAPATTTTSVTHNPLLAAGYAGADRFGIEVFAPETTRALMAALWVHDLRCEESAANPARPLAHPCELFIETACHGGMWACAYVPRTALPFAAALGWASRKRS